MLLLENIDVYYGKIKVIRELSLEVAKGQLIALLGANGTGKTTIINTISGFLSPRKGTIRYRGKRIDKSKPHEIVKMGIVQVSQGRDLFPDLSVFDNLYLGSILQKDNREIDKSLQRIFGYFPRLQERQGQLAKDLSGGEQQMLAIGRAFMGTPELMLLDEPTTGLAPLLVKKIADIIETIRNEGATILLVEQNALMAVSLADYFYILRDGQIVKEGPTNSLPENLKEFFRQYYI
jgi:branched-chain amino acid transport system ATP-binding protein